MSLVVTQVQRTAPDFVSAHHRRDLSVTAGVGLLSVHVDPRTLLTAADFAKSIGPLLADKSTTDAPASSSSAPVARSSVSSSAPSPAAPAAAAPEDATAPAEPMCIYVQATLQGNVDGPLAPGPSPTSPRIPYPSHRVVLASGAFATQAFWSICSGLRRTPKGATSLWRCSACARRPSRSTWPALPSWWKAT